MVPETMSQTDKIINEFVKFEDIMISYDISQDFYVVFSCDDSVKGSSKDWIGIFEGGWNFYETFLDYECALGIPCDQYLRKRKVKFLSKNLQHAKPGIPYQFVYVNKYLEIMGVSQYFKFTNKEQSYNLLDDTSKELTFVPKDESSFKETQQNDKGCENENQEEDIIFLEGGTCDQPRYSIPYVSCNLHSISKWEHSYTSCHQCMSIFKLKARHDEMQEKLKRYQDSNFALEERVHYLEKRLKCDESMGKADLESRMIHLSDAVESAIRASLCKEDVNKEVAVNECFDWDFSSKELYLKAVIGSQELTIRDLSKVICEHGYIDHPKLCHQTQMSLQDTVKRVRAQEKVLPEIYEINSTSEEEF